MKRGLLLFFVLLVPFVSAVSVEKVEIQDKEVVITIQGKVSSQIEFFKEGLSKGTYKLCEDNICDFTARKELRIRLSNTGINEAGDYVLRIQEIDSNGQAAVQSYNLKINKENLDICTDGTLNNACSANKPLFCDNGKLIEKCGKGTFTYYTNNLELGITTRHETARCGECASGKTCQADGSCVEVKKKEVSRQTGLSGAGEGCVSEQGALFDNPSLCNNYNNPQQCNACGLCIWDSKHCCPKGMKWDSSKSMCSEEVKSTKPNCADYDFNKDGEVGFSDSSTLSEQKIDYNKDGEYSWMDKILFLWDINLVGSGGCVWSDEALMELALSGNPGKCDEINDIKLKNACNHITITSAMLAGDVNVDNSLNECNNKFEDTEKQNCIDRINVFSGQCGNNIINEGEECDGSILNIQGHLQTCSSLGYSRGDSSCSLCKIDTSKCYSTCGDGYANIGEECDTDIGTKKCSDLGFVKGYLKCKNCKFDTSQCNSCGNKVCEYKNGENFIDCPADCSQTKNVVSILKDPFVWLFPQFKNPGTLVVERAVFDASSIITVYDGNEACQKKYDDPNAKLVLCNSNPGWPYGSIGMAAYACKCQLSPGVKYCGDGVCDYWRGGELAEDYSACSSDCPGTNIDVVSTVTDNYVWKFGGVFRICPGSDKKYELCHDSESKQYTNGNEACRAKYDDPNAKLSICNSNQHDHPIAATVKDRYGSLYGLVCKCEL